ARWQADALDDYGTDCPGMTALAGCRQLQHQQIKKAQAIDKMVNPHLQVPADLTRNTRAFLPGGTTPYNQTTAHGGIRPIHDVNFRLDYMLQDIGEVQGRINESFFVDLFLMISQQDDIRTATEITLRNEEKLLALGPTLQRVQTELLDPMIDRVFSLMERAGAIPPAPEEMNGQQLEVKYVSMLAQAQQTVGASSIERYVQMAGAIAAVQPNVLHKVNYDGVMDEYGDILGVPKSLINSEEDVAATRQAEAEQAQQAQQAELAASAAQTAKTASEVNVSDDGPLAQLLG
ncbi:portal protein, partial [uncultured Tateyamaria sp.]|uniref:portal protein n=1 Tax=uncultured Tateyamaria sp. TaxID=455651 RepID=UPI00262CE5A5